jgi:hypothetical protein
MIAASLRSSVDSVGISASLFSNVSTNNNGIKPVTSLARDYSNGVREQASWQAFD